MLYSGMHRFKSLCLAGTIAVCGTAASAAVEQSSNVPAWLQKHVGEGEGQIADVVLQRARALYLKKVAAGVVKNPCYFAMDATRPHAGGSGKRFYTICEAERTFRAAGSGLTRDASKLTASVSGTRPAAERTSGGSMVAQFQGRPAFEQGQAVLIDQTVEKATRLGQIAVELDVPPAQLDRGLALWVNVQDLAMPRARIRLADLMRLGSKRPLNLAVQAGEAVRIVLVDPNGAWAKAAPSITVQIAS